MAVKHERGAPLDEPPRAVLRRGVATTDANDTRQRLLRAAATEIARHGFKGASLRGVAARADIRAASIFHFFPDGKEQLARAMLEHIMETIATRMTPTLDAASDIGPPDLIVRCTAELWDFMAEHPEYAGALMREAFQADEDSIADVVTASWLIERAGDASWSCAGLPAGRGRVKTAHGFLPVPAPATALLLEGFPLSNRLLLEIHQRLLARGRGADKDPGRFRRSQVWIALIFASDGSGNLPEGAYVDSIVLRKYVQGYGGLASREPAAQPEGDGGSLIEMPVHKVLSPGGGDGISP